MHTVDLLQIYRPMIETIITKEKAFAYGYRYKNDQKGSANQNATTNHLWVVVGLWVIVF